MDIGKINSSVLASTWFYTEMVELYLSSEVSYQELALSQGMNNSSLIIRWVQDFRAVGSDALRPKKKGRKKTLNSKKPYNKATTLKTDISMVDTSEDHVREVEDELLKLRIENSFL